MTLVTLYAPRHKSLTFEPEIWICMSSLLHTLKFCYNNEICSLRNILDVKIPTMLIKMFELYNVVIGQLDNKQFIERIILKRKGGFMHGKNVEFGNLIPRKFVINVYFYQMTENIHSLDHGNVSRNCRHTKC